MPYGSVRWFIPVATGFVLATTAACGDYDPCASVPSPTLNEQKALDAAVEQGFEVEYPVSADVDCELEDGTWEVESE